MLMTINIKPHLRTNLFSISKMSASCLILEGTSQLHFSGKRLRCGGQDTGSPCFISVSSPTELEVEARSLESQSSSAFLRYLWLSLSVGKEVLDYCHECNFQRPWKKKKEWKLLLDFR